MEDYKHLCWEKLTEKDLVNDQWIEFKESSWKFPDGAVWSPYYTFTRRDYVVIVARCPDGKFVTVRQFRQGIEQVTSEFPAGGIEKGESPLDAAKRELAEETGYVSDEWRPVARIPSYATMAGNYAYIFYAGNCRLETTQSLDPMEFVEVVLMEDEQLHEQIRQDGFHQAVHIAAYYRAMEN